MLWLIATLIGGFFQSWRTAVQQRVRATLSVNAAGLVRYLYGLPVACVLFGGYVLATDSDLPGIGSSFLVNALAGGLAQIIGTNLLIMAFGYRNFVVGTAYSKTEAIQGAFLALALLGEMPSALTWLGIAVGATGVVRLSLGTNAAQAEGVSIWRTLPRQLTQPAALCGLGAGFSFALTSIFVKRATLVIDTPDKIFAALFTLVAVLALQTVMQGSYVAWRERDQLSRIARSWRVSGQVGVLAALGSACWFSAFALAPVALVRAVGQVEVLFTLFFGKRYLGEQAQKHEQWGLLLVAVGVVLALAGSLP
jgi:drug/metabolite transporter (DMT)-like permease